MPLVALAPKSERLPHGRRRVRQDAPVSDETRRYWDEQAATFDEEADHGLRDPTVRRAWADLLLPHLPTAPARVVDLGCGTGSLSLLLAEAGHDVHGVDLSPRMVYAARAKAAAAGAPLASASLTPRHPQ